MVMSMEKCIALLSVDSTIFNQNLPLQVILSCISAILTIFRRAVCQIFLTLHHSGYRDFNMRNGYRHLVHISHYIHAHGTVFMA